MTAELDPNCCIASVTEWGHNRYTRGYYVKDVRQCRNKPIKGQPTCGYHPSDSLPHGAQPDGAIVWSQGAGEGVER